MEWKTIKELNIGDVLARPIYNENHTPLFNEGKVLEEKDIKSLERWFENNSFQRFPINTPGTENIIFEDKISELVRSETAKAIRNKQIDELIKKSKVISRQIISHDIHDVDYYDIRNNSDYMSRHSVNVAIIACIIGRNIGFSEKELEEITLAGLLNDYARMSINDISLSKVYKEKLERERQENITGNKNDLLNKIVDVLLKEKMEDSYISYRLLKDTDYAKNGEIPATVLNSILVSHLHENCIVHNNLEKYKYSSILHVADIYDMLASNDLESIKANLPQNTLYLFNINGGINPKNIVGYFARDYGTPDESQRLFDKKVVNSFLKCVSVYTKGRRVVLSNGDIAVVNKNIPGRLERPKVDVIEGEFKGKSINLSDREYFNISIIDYAKTEDNILDENPKQKM